MKGFQVAPAELEALLLKHPRIADAAVIPVPDDEARRSAEGDRRRARAAHRRRGDRVRAREVAHYKRIRHVEFVDAIPKSASGKILRRVLVERERARR